MFDCWACCSERRNEEYEGLGFENRSHPLISERDMVNIL